VDHTTSAGYISAMRLGDIATLVGGVLRGDPALEIRAAAALGEAGRGTLAFYADERHRAQLERTEATAVLVPPDVTSTRFATIEVAQPYDAFVTAVEVLHRVERGRAEVHPTAVLHPEARVADDAHVGPHVVVGAGSTVGRRAVLHAGVCLYENVTIGDDFTAHANVTVREGTRIGDRVTLHAGAVVGSDGFGYLPRPEGPRKIPQVGIVVLEDDVEIGANATVDRAALGETRVERGVKIDNLVMVAHGCRIGAGSLLAGQVGLAGGTVLGRGVMLGGQVGSAGHLTIGDGAMVAAKSGIHSDLDADTTYGGYPAVEIRRWRRATAAVHRIGDLARRLKRLEREMAGGRRQDD
jgi:UDP-3-O-[3-hydroxymyristoyl] glucosamine N-acyltransferase